jgi:endonuclease-3
MTKKQKALKIAELLQGMYPEATCSLEYKDPLQLMVATQLAAQCTDARVNIVTKDLFRKYRTEQDFANADLEELEQDIRSTGFYHNKAKNIIAACRMIISDYGGNVPSNIEDLLKLPGVGRKTANLILNDSFGVPGVVIDTHAKRLTNRMGLTENEDPEKIEYDLMKLLPAEKWGSFCHQLVFHGRALCDARKPKCGDCPILPHCRFGSGQR